MAEDSVERENQVAKAVGKVYSGLLTRDEEFLVFVKTPNDFGGSLRELEHIVRHSSDGFSWGWVDGGASDLALSILTDLVGAEMAEAHYQDFKLAFIARLNGDSWEITEAAIREWLGYRQSPECRFLEDGQEDL